MSRRRGERERERRRVASVAAAEKQSKFAAIFETTSRMSYVHG